MASGFRGALVLPRVGKPEAGTVSNEPLPKELLIQHIAAGMKPRDKWKIGTEHEKFGFQHGSNARITYPQIEKVLQSLVSRFGWKPMEEEGRIIGVSLDGQSVTIEPGGQFELSGAPVDTIQKTCAEVNNHLYQVKTISEELGFGFMGSGFDPKWGLADIPLMPKERYKLMTGYMPKVGSMGLDMMRRTCTVQVNLDYESEADCIEKFQIGLALQPVANALFASSPFKEGKPTG
ncbi:glutamate-cysteine ligase family 2-domain-containing protein [Dunaliella salina]|uniref:glutamate--cysteine ligase n=1 Tax=Dunaliella salina TaxID=3046 RepID=A0ABQ7FU25_DUNSA|nr:glutamate-cysteine ligase family 2-domain-containing protein [Dunaliella salina]|eukprot:KAF5825492.1 glutamate-cysteine ligase family 2-domain-containing protein [Dunaliella salina]